MKIVVDYHNGVREALPANYSSIREASNRIKRLMKVAYRNLMNGEETPIYFAVVDEKGVVRKSWGISDIKYSDGVRLVK